MILSRVGMKTYSVGFIYRHLLVVGLDWDGSISREFLPLKFTVMVLLV